MVFWYLLVIIAFIGILFSTVVDIKKREVPNWVSYSLIGVGFGIRAIYSLIYEDFSFLLYGALGFIIFFIFANLMYYTKQWGGGDCKLLMGLGVLFGNYEPIFNTLHNLPFLGTLLLNIFVAGAFWGILFSTYLAIKNWNKFILEYRKQDFTIFKVSAAIVFLVLIITYFILDRLFFKFAFIFLILLLFMVFLINFIRAVENCCMYKLVNVDKLVEGDWIVNDVKKNKKIIVKVRNIGLTLNDLNLLKKNNIKKVLVKEGVPFVPGFLIGFLVSVFLGDWFLIFI
ncbi:prepilin peptidase [Candidatus Woesearchaeota archaeon]|nr:prepilin peptidase [Candidatus Woesearchaeota archaeon]